MEDRLSLAASLPDTPAPETPPLTVSPADTSLDSSAKVEEVEETKPEKKPAKKRKSWGQELPIPKTNLPPRKRAKTEDEKEQRRIERVLRNRAAAQTSRERKRLEMEKLEGEKTQIEQQNQLLLQRLSQMEAENQRLSRQVAQLSAEVRGSRGTTPKPVSATTKSPTLTATLFKQEGDDADFPLDRVPFPTSSPTDYSPTLTPSTLAEPSDATQHPAVSVTGLEGAGSALPLYGLGCGGEPLAADNSAVPISDDDFRRLFSGSSSAESNPSVLEDGFSFDVLDGGDLSSFAFDSLVDFDSELVLPEGVQPPSGLSDETPFQTSSVQPSLGASAPRCDGQSIAASC